MRKIKEYSTKNIEKIILANTKTNKKQSSITAWRVNDDFDSDTDGLFDKLVNAVEEIRRNAVNGIDSVIVFDDETNDIWVTYLSEGERYNTPNYHIVGGDKAVNLTDLEEIFNTDEWEEDMSEEELYRTLKELYIEGDSDNKMTIEEEAEMILEKIQEKLN